MRMESSSWGLHPLYSPGLLQQKKLHPLGWSPDLSCSYLTVFAFAFPVRICFFQFFLQSPAVQFSVLSTVLSRPAPSSLIARSFSQTSDPFVSALLRTLSGIPAGLAAFLFPGFQLRSALASLRPTTFAFPSASPSDLSSGFFLGTHRALPSCFPFRFPFRFRFPYSPSFLRALPCVST